MFYLPHCSKILNIPRTTYSVFDHRWKRCCTSILDTIMSMPRAEKSEPKRTHELNRIKIVGNSLSSTPPGIVNMQVLGSGARGGSKSLYLFTDRSRYLFNCGEGTQRLAHEYKMSLTSLEHVFITYPSWENLGGIPGFSLTVQEAGVTRYTIHGCDKAFEFYKATKGFATLRRLNVAVAPSEQQQPFVDNTMTVQYVPLESNKSTSEAQREDLRAEGPTVDDTDYYAHERIGSNDKEGDKKITDEDKSQYKQSTDPITWKRTIPVSMSYICTLHPRPGTLNIEQCVKLGVPPGPLLGKLKNGEDVVLPNGKKVMGADVTSPIEPGLTFIVVECPSEDYLNSLMTEKSYSDYQGKVSDKSKCAAVVVHFSPPEIMEHKSYKEWMNRFPYTTNHLVINEDSDFYGGTAAHKMQCKLNLLHSHIFPKLSDYRSLRQQRVTNNREKSECSISPNTHQGRILSSIRLRPLRGRDPFIEPGIEVHPNEYIDEAIKVEGFSNELAKLKQKLTDMESMINTESGGLYPKLVFLGTGSCIPNKIRNTSGIVLQMSEDVYVLLDCGEGTCGQMVRFYGKDKADEVLRKLKAIFISHMHADHHTGLIYVLRERKRAFDRLKKKHGDNDLNRGAEQEEFSRVYLLAPTEILSWLNFYHNNFEELSSLYQIFQNGDLMNVQALMLTHEKVQLLKTLKMLDIVTCVATHCMHSFCVAFTLEGGVKVSYSGDTMPTPKLVEIGANSDILIHEATMEDELAGEAKLKLHSTTSQAINIGRQMQAKFIMLTHFSQRYPKIPRLDDSFAFDDIGFAFDNMQMSRNQLPMIPKMIPALKLMFSEEVNEIEYKAKRRLWKIKRTASISPERTAKCSRS